MKKTKMILATLALAAVVTGGFMYAADHVDQRRQ